MVAPNLEAPAFVKDMIHVTSYADVNAVLRSPDMFIFRDEYVGEFLARTLTALNGPEHHARRRMEAGLFTGPALRRYESETLMPLLEEFFDDCRREADDEGVWRGDLVDSGLYLLVRLGALIGGLDGADTRDRATVLMRFVEQWSLGAGFEWVNLPANEKQQLLQHLIEVRDEYAAAYFQPSLERRLLLSERFRAGEISEHELPRDVLMTLLLHRQPDWDDALLFREAALYLHASIKTTTRGLTHSIDELYTWFVDHPEDRWILDDMNELRGAVGEVLRIHPLLPAMVRRAVRDVELPSGTLIPENAEVAVLFANANRDKEVFGDDADEFDPFRHRRTKSSIAPYGFAFGGGAHVCMGRRMAAGSNALSEDDVATSGTLATLVQSFFRAGVAPDPERAPTWGDETAYHEYSEYPIVLGSVGEPQ